MTDTLPPDAHLREQSIDSREVYRGHFLHVRRDRVQLPDGQEAAREYIVHPGAVMIVPLLDDGRLVVERQWRYPLHRAFIEFPAGKLDAGEPVLACAIRELAEETGYRAREWARAGLLHNAIAYSNEGIEIWFARGLSLGERHLDEGEFLDVQTTTLEALEDQAARGELTDAKTLIGMLWLRHWREGRWALDWQASPPGPDHASSAA
ncbi:NUDIX domain-containing protein [Aquariibacter albus]|uniref:GDP-mannose pyrophosphatase n=1 Tax=Aquariibacter albus TaxID=2759899 RepID=A0A839HGS3_9BURK|nr:NUDIX hydrolase [Aquariibacter albus]MBB1160853.1 NUDIX hydrolase [Aquariibacter albus]